MNKRQKAILVKFGLVIVATVIAIAAMVNFKDWVNHTEAVRAMEQLSELVLQYRENHGSVPPESYIDDVKEKLMGSVRIGDLKYRARWISLGCSADEVLAYVKRSYNSFILEDGFIVLKFDGRVEYIGVKQFTAILAEQQSPAEVEMQGK